MDITRFARLRSLSKPEVEKTNSAGKAKTTSAGNRQAIGASLRYARSAPA